MRPWPSVWIICQERSRRPALILIFGRPKSPPTFFIDGLETFDTEHARLPCSTAPSAGNYCWVSGSARLALLLQNASFKTSRRPLATAKFVAASRASVV
jgi:hypothetical protein